ncbi:hypothetical protein Tco_0667079 [Tanacetum coccineum]
MAARSAHCYVPESDPEEDLEEDDDEDPEEDPADYPADRGDMAMIRMSYPMMMRMMMLILRRMRRRSTQLLPTLQLLLYQPLIMIFNRDEPPTHFLVLITEVARLPCILLLHHHTFPMGLPLPQIPSPPLPPILSPLRVSSPPASPIRSLGYRAAMIRLRAEAPSTSHSLPLPPPIILSHTRPDAPIIGTHILPIPAPTTSSPPLLLPSTNRREDRPEVTLPPRKRLGIVLGPRYEVGESLSADLR